MENIRSSLTGIDALVGLCAIIIFSVVLIGFRYQAIPEYRLGQIADQDVRAVQDVIYEDTAATNLKRAEAEAAAPVVYRLDSELIANRQQGISSAFSTARSILARYSVQPGVPIPQAVEKTILYELETQVGATMNADVLPALLRQRFDPALEGRILKTLDQILRRGIIDDRGRFLKDQRTGIVMHDSSLRIEQPLTDAYLPRDLASAKESLRQNRQAFSDIPERDRALLTAQLENALFPTLFFDPLETEARRARAVMRVSPVAVQIRQGQTIVRSGEQITQNTLLQLAALRNLRQPKSLIWQFCGYVLLLAILIYSLWRYLVFYQTRHRKIRNHMTLILVVIAIELMVMRLTTTLADILSERFPRFHDPFVLYYGIPFAFGALLITLLVDVNLGVLSSMALALMAGLFFGDVDLAVYLTIGSLAGIYSVRQYKDRAAILKAGLTIGCANILCLLGLDVLRQAPLKPADFIDQVVLALISGTLASALASMMLPALESVFKIATDVRLLELSNLNAPMLRRLSVEAPGTYHHSLMVATLAEAAAEAVGANPLLSRAAAYYHDIGKILNPEYFVENQAYGGNKHEELSPRDSCLIIANHVNDGLEMAREAGLPLRISDMIPQHHGTRVMTFFYEKAKNSAGSDPAPVNVAAYRYPGPKPQSKEAAIMMMADSVEAASRTLSDPSLAQVKGMIDQLVDGIVSDNQFAECDITLKEVQLAKESFLKILSGIFHHRIDYPGYDFTRVSENAETSAR